MDRVSTTVLCLAFTLCVSAIVSPPAYAQNITTGSLSGVVMDQQKGVLPGATLTATHVPTGTMYEAVTLGDDRYNMPSVRVGGPYTIKVTMLGFKAADTKDIAVGHRRQHPGSHHRVAADDPAQHQRLCVHLALLQRDAGRGQHRRPAGQRGRPQQPVQQHAD